MGTRVLVGTQGCRLGAGLTGGGANDHGGGIGRGIIGALQEHIS